MLLNLFCRLLALYEGVQLNYVNPPNLGMPEEIKNFINTKKVPQKECGRLEDVLAETDILYMTRIQQERFNTKEEYQKVRSFNYFSKLFSSRSH